MDCEDCTDLQKSQNFFRRRAALSAKLEFSAVLRYTYGMIRDQSSDALRAKALELLPDQLLNADEQVALVVKPSGWLIGFLSFRFGVIGMIMAVGLMLFGSAAGLGRATGWLIILAGVALLGRILFALCQWAARSYVLTDSRIITLDGVFTVHVFQCDLTKVQNTFIQLPFIPRLFGLGHIAITTAGTGAIEAVLSYCNQPLRIHERITKNIEDLKKS
jgi:membrane protein YdbS with pleckstrin-like domain